MWTEHEILDSTEHKAIVDSIEHWERMIAWAEKQDPGDLVSSDDMLVGIGEIWGGADCPLCQLARVEARDSCFLCTLGCTHGHCNAQRSANAWSDDKMARHWKDWLMHARRMLVQLKSLLPGKEDT